MLVHGGCSWHCRAAAAGQCARRISWSRRQAIGNVVLHID
jgi:hypothetical protein